MDNKIFIKVVFLGESEVGKTSLIDRYISGDFYDHPTSTANYSSKKINCDGKEYAFDIWDTSGYEKYRALTKYFIIDAHIIVLVYDILCINHFDFFKSIHFKIIISFNHYYLIIIDVMKNK